MFKETVELEMKVAYRRPTATVHTEFLEIMARAPSLPEGIPGVVIFQYTGPLSLLGQTVTDQAIGRAIFQAIRRAITQ